MFQFPNPTSFSKNGRLGDTIILLARKCFNFNVLTSQSERIRSLLSFSTDFQNLKQMTYTIASRSYRAGSDMSTNLSFVVHNYVLSSDIGSIWLGRLGHRTDGKVQRCRLGV